MKLSTYILLFYFLIGPVLGRSTAPILNSFPVKSLLWLSSSKVYIAPAQTAPLQIPYEGDLQIKIPNFTFVKKGEVWGVANPEQLRLKEESLVIEERKFNQQLKSLRLDHFDKIAQEREKLEALRMKKAKLSHGLKSPEVAAYPSIQKTLKKSIQSLSEQLVRAESRFEDLKKGEMLQTSISSLKLDFEKKQFEMKDLRKKSHLLAPFNGTLNFQLDALSEKTNYPVNVWVSGTSIVGSISNTERFEVILQVTNPALLSVSKHSLVLMINDQIKRQKIKAKYFRRRPLKNPSEQTLPVLVFLVDEKDSLKAQDLMNNHLLASVYTELPPNCHLVPKSKLLAFLKSAEENQPNWESAVKSLWPQCRLVAIGKNVLAVQER